jgi:hypothetical protein
MSTIDIEHPTNRDNFSIVWIGHGVRVAFSYSTPIGVYVTGEGWTLRTNEWGPTTGKHLNYLDQIPTSRAPRVSGEIFKDILSDVLKVDDNWGRQSTPTQPFTGEVGCWLDSALGWHNTYRAIDIAVSYGYRLRPWERKALEDYRDGKTIEESPDTEWVHETLEQSLEWLNDRVIPDNMFVDFFEGNLICAEWLCGDPNSDDCDSDECAHSFLW